MRAFFAVGHFACLPASSLLPAASAPISSFMKFEICCPLGLLLCFLVTHGRSKSEVQVGYRVLVQVPDTYTSGSSVKAFLMETKMAEASLTPSFRAALSVEAAGGGYSCALQVFLGDVRVWSSGHFSRFYTLDECVIELSRDGDLRLKGPNDQIGWRTGTSGQGVERFRLLKNGNLILVDSMNHTKWQSFNFPTNVLLLGQRIGVATRLTSFPTTNTTSFYSLEIQSDQIALYLNLGNAKYSYWQFKPLDYGNISFVELGSEGLELFDQRQQQIGRIESQMLPEPVQFLELGNATGNLKFYYYSPINDRFEVSFQALNNICDLPMACKPYGVCTLANECSCIRLAVANQAVSTCPDGFSNRFCGGDAVKMLEIRAVSSVLRGSARSVNVSKETCSAMCLSDCKCSAALYTTSKDARGLRVCYLYNLVTGVRQVMEGTSSLYLLKVPKATDSYHEKTPGLQKWVIIVVGVADGLILFLVLAGFSYYIIRKRRKRNTAASGGDT